MLDVVWLFCVYVVLGIIWLWLMVVVISVVLCVVSWLMVGLIGYKKSFVVFVVGFGGFVLFGLFD